MYFLTRVFQIVTNDKCRPLLEHESHGGTLYVHCLLFSAVEEKKNPVFPHVAPQVRVFL